MTRGEVVPLNLDRFTSVSEGERLVADAFTTLGRIANGLRPSGKGTVILMRQLGGAAVVARARALHEGAVREALAGNPAAALTLIRALVEVLAVASYALRREPDYLEFLMNSTGELGPRAPRRRSMQYLIDKAADDGLGGIGHLYAQLSDIAHFGAEAAILPMRASHDDGTRRVGFSAKPAWRSEKHLLNALAMIEEQTMGIARLVEQYIDQYVTPLLADPTRAEREGQVFGWATEPPPAEPPLNSGS
jgi:hypothetical protein